MFENIKVVPKDELFGLVQEYKNDPRKNKIKLSVGVYENEDGSQHVLDIIQQEAKKTQVEDFYYLPISGDQKFLNGCKNVLLGDKIDTKTLVQQQIAGGTHGIRLFSDLLARAKGKGDIIIGTPTWENHFGIFKEHNIQKINHLNKEMDVDFSSYTKAVKQAKDESVLLIHGGDTHNPTGKNLSLQQIQEILQIMNKKQMTLFVDYAYIGFGDGVDKDLEWLRDVYALADSVAFSVSFSKNATMFKHRTGVFLMKTDSEDKKKAIESNLQNIVRESISNLPAYGSNILAEIFNNQKKIKKWKSEVEELKNTIDRRKDKFVEVLGKDFSYMKNTKGMFAMLGIDEEQVQRLKKENAVYIPKNSRISFAGMKTKDIEKVAKLIQEIVKR